MKKGVDRLRLRMRISDYCLALASDLSLRLQVAGLLCLGAHALARYTVVCLFVCRGRVDGRARPTPI